METGVYRDVWGFGLRFADTVSKERRNGTDNGNCCVKPFLPI